MKKKTKIIPLYCPNRECSQFRKVIDYEVDITGGYIEWGYPACVDCLRHLVLPNGYQKYRRDSDTLG